MNTEISVEDLSFLQLSHSFFPMGLYTTSNGLEFIFHEKKLKSRDILKLIKIYLKQQLGPGDCVTLGNAYECAEKSIVPLLKTEFSNPLNVKLNHV